MSKLDEYQAICDAATPGEWESAADDKVLADINGHPHHVFQVTSPDGGDGVEWDGTGVACVIVPFEETTAKTLHDAAMRADFIATARSAMPKLIACVRELRELSPQFQYTYPDVIIDKHLGDTK